MNTRSVEAAREEPSEIAHFVHWPLPDGQSFPLIDLQPSENYSADIVCTLRHVTLEDSEPYKALSYVWGDANITLPIQVDGKEYHVTVNCHAALQRLRQFGVKTIWIDAICINQRDDVEKSHQV